MKHEFTPIDKPVLQLAYLSLARMLALKASNVRGTWGATLLRSTM